jgi:hypothetical protein
MVEKRFFVAIIVIALVFIAGNSYAQLVQCGNDPNNPCGYNNLIGPGGVIDNVVQLVVFQVGIPVTIGFIIYGGILIMISAGNSERVQRGKKVIKSAIIGITIAFGAWLIVQTILRFLLPNAV